MTGSLVQASQVTVEVEDAGFADRALRQTPTSTNNVACSSGLSAVKFGADVICVQSADGRFSGNLALVPRGLCNCCCTTVLVQLVVVTYGHESAA